MDGRAAPGLQEVLARLRRAEPQLRATYHLKSLRVFGSTARGTARPDSDVDILVDFTRTPSLFTLVHLKDDLEAAIGRPVDVVLFDGLRPELRADVLSSAVAV